MESKGEVGGGGQGKGLEEQLSQYAPFARSPG